jgi:hypothetical protein
LDTRRALGIYGRVSVPNLKLQPSTLWRYWPAQKKAIFFCADPLNYEFEIQIGLVFDGDLWTYEEGSRVSSVWRRKDKYVFSEYKPRPFQLGFSFAENPQFITE